MGIAHQDWVKERRHSHVLRRLPLCRLQLAENCNYRRQIPYPVYGQVLHALEEAQNFFIRMKTLVAR